jgi:hypothetical protein
MAWILSLIEKSVWGRTSENTRSCNGVANDKRNPTIVRMIQDSRHRLSITPKETIEAHHPNQDPLE